MQDQPDIKDETKAPVGIDYSFLDDLEEVETLPQQPEKKAKATKAKKNKAATKPKAPKPKPKKKDIVKRPHSVNCKLSDEEFAAFNAKLDGRTRADIVRRLIAEYSKS